MKPKRIQRKRVKGWRIPRNTIYVGRPSRWGNPFKTVEEFRNDLVKKHFHDPLAYVAIKYHLKGKNLCCWCPLDKPCHSDILLKIANED